LANHKSAIKRTRQDEKRRLRNKMVKTRMRNVIKQTRQDIDKRPQEADQTLQEAMRVIDKAAAKGTIHRRTASRRIARLARHLSKARSQSA
jgi:small subunit ribosomal protein S20